MMTAERFNELSDTYFVVSPTKEPHKFYIVEKQKVGFQKEVDFARKARSNFEGDRLVPYDYSIPPYPTNDPLKTTDLDILYLENGQLMRDRMSDLRSSY